MEVKLTPVSLLLVAAVHLLHHRGLLSYGCTGHHLLMTQVLRYATHYYYYRYALVLAMLRSELLRAMTRTVIARYQ
jgi:hypothetical protein